MSIITPPWKIRFFEKLRKAESSLSINLTLSAAGQIEKETDEVSYEKANIES